MDRLMSCNGGNFPLLLLCPTSIRLCPCYSCSAHEKKMAIEAHTLETLAQKKDTRLHLLLKLYVEWKFCILVKLSEWGLKLNWQT